MLIFILIMCPIKKIPGSPFVNDVDTRFHAPIEKFSLQEALTYF